MIPTPATLQIPLTRDTPPSTRPAPEIEAPGQIGDAFAELLLAEVMKGFRETMTDSMFGSGSGSSTYAAWFDDLIGREFAQSLGLGEQLAGENPGQNADFGGFRAERAAFEAYSALEGRDLP